MGRTIPADEDDNPIGCDWCGKAVNFERLSRDTAQFPLGTVEVFDDAREVFSLGADWVLGAKEVVALHVSGEHGSVNDEIAQRNYEVTSLLPFVQVTDHIVSQFFTKGAFVWVITTPARGQTVVLGRESMESRVQN